jgi:hypothetical protein
MRIILTENDIKKALIAYTSTLGLDLASHHVEIELTAGRGANGHSATVIIDEADDTKNVKEPLTGSMQAPVSGVTPRAIAAKVVEAPEVVEDVKDAGEIEIPAVTPETEGHESGEKKSLFD